MKLEGNSNGLRRQLRCFLCLVARGVSSGRRARNAILEREVMPRAPKSFFTKGQLFAPKFIPKRVAQIEEEARLPAATGVAGVIGGVPGWQLGGVLGGILGGIGHAPAPPRPTPVAHKGPYRVGGKVQAPRLIRQVQPEYPPLAKQARIQGDVVIDSLIDTQGRVTEMKVVSGRPLLVQSAIQALGQWRYQPTLLNAQPVAVDMLVTLHFTLGQNSQPTGFSASRIS
jgi:periplasmic protein TonB